MWHKCCTFVGMDNISRSEYLKLIQSNERKLITELQQVLVENRNVILSMDLRLTEIKKHLTQVQSNAVRNIIWTFILSFIIGLMVGSF